MALISFAVTAKLVCVFVFAYADCCFSHEAAHLFLSFIKIFDILSELQQYIAITGSLLKCL